jgi:anti-sigma B factor antagonist
MITSVRIENEVAIITLVGSLDVSLQKTFKQELQEHIDKSGSDIVLDFTGVTFIDSSCLGALVALSKSVRDKKGDIKIACALDEVRAIFQITRLDRMFRLFDTVREAIDDYFSS